MLIRIATAAAVIGIGLGGAACSSNESASTTTAASEAASGSTSSVPKSFQLDTPNGQVSLSLDGQLPPGWPQDFPLPNGTQPAGSGSLGGQTSTVRVGVFSTSESGQAAYDFYSQNTGLTTTDQKSAGVGQTFIGKLSLTSPYTGSVTVASHDSTTYIVVILEGDIPQSTSTTGAGSTSSTTSGAGSTSTSTTTGAGTPQ